MMEDLENGIADSESVQSGARRRGGQKERKFLIISAGWLMR
jgi:hypothetical protein